MLTKGFAGIMALSMVAASCPVQGLAVTGSEVAADGTYTSSKAYNVVNDEPEEWEWDDYDVTVSIVVKDGLIDNLTVKTGDTYSTNNDSYLNGALNSNTSKRKGILTQLKGQPATVETIEKCDTVSSATIVSSAIKEAALDAIRQAPVKEDDTGYVYGTVNLPYADFYYGELNDVKESADIDLEAADKVTEAGYREKGIYDAVSSATTNKSKNFAATYYYTEKENGVDIEGIKDVYVAIPKSLYKKAKSAIADKTACNNKLLDIVSNVTLLDEDAEAPSEYKVLNGDGTLTKMVTEVKEDTEITATIATGSVWGDYLISLYKDGATYNPLTREEMLGCILETADGAKYGLTHLENLWFQTYEFSFAVTEGFTEPHGNVLDHQRFADIQGKTIKKITYLVKDGTDVVINTNLKVKKLLDNGQIIELTPQTEAALYQGGEKVDVKNTTPADTYTINTITFGGKILSAGTDYTYADGVITINETDNTGVGKYTVNFKDAEYEDVTAEFILNSEQVNEKAEIEDNKLVLPKDVDTIAYIKNISAVKVNGKAVNNAAAVICNEDGTINLLAATKGRGATTLFPDYGDYEVVIESDGYPTASGKVTKKVDKYVYATVNMPYADFYYGELTEVKESPNLDLTAEDKVSTAGYRDKGMYDAVSSATTQKSKNFAATYYTEKENGVDIEGLKDVNIAIPADLYAKASDAIEKNQTSNNKVLEFVKNATLIEEGADTPAEYKILNGDGTFSKMVTEVETDKNITAQISTDSRWGDYLISLYKNDAIYNPVERENVLGCVLETSDGVKYGLTHLENLWFQTYEMSFAATEGFTEPHGNVLDYERFADIQGKTIKKITYLVKDGADIVVETELKVKTLLTEKTQGITAEVEGDAEFKDGVKVNITITAPSGNHYLLAKADFKGKTLEAGKDYTIEAVEEAKVLLAGGPSDSENHLSASDTDTTQVLTINKTENTGVGQYTLVFKDAEYEDVIVNFVLNSESVNEKASIENNALVLPEGIALADYIGNISSVSVNGEVINNAGSVLFNEDGTVNLDAATTGKRGTTLFPENAKYEVTVQSYGYPTASGTVIKEAGDRAALEEAVEKAGEIETDKYTDETVEGFNQALKAANTVYDNLDATQEEIDAATSALNAAVEALREKVETPDGNNEPEDNTNDNNNSGSDNTDNRGSDNSTNSIENNSTENNSTDNSAYNEIASDNLSRDSAMGNANAANRPADQLSKSDHSVKTGDNTGIWGIFSAMVTALGALGLTLKLKKKESDETE